MIGGKRRTFPDLIRQREFFTGVVILLMLTGTWVIVGTIGDDRLAVENF
ncbi:hypothetical protein LCGC14_2832960 [marine sediment metagenome]|uniref:Uncharacterized protein n=1 Tax=marine sediment metagenome TaxID=412755 RepID=A0A0F8YDM7_9ZZZZ